MTAFLHDHDTKFPPPEQADEQGILAIGGDFSPRRLLAAYRAGIFPWPHPGLPILWFCPDPRFILRPHKIVVGTSLAKAMRTSRLTIRADENFTTVMRHCQSAYRPDQAGTWITDDMIKGYHQLFMQGFAHSVEAYLGDRLVGGLYGLALGRAFFGESMFFHEANASKICFVTLVAHLVEWGFSLIDCQAHTIHLEKFGAEFLPRANFLNELAILQREGPSPHPWRLHMTPTEALAYLRERLTTQT
jgi:leucyl/phenylalanyl-tRNA--protein transferase